MTEAASTRPGRAWWGRVAWVCRSLHRLFVLVLALGVVGAAGAVGLAWRLSKGPLEIEWAARRIEAGHNVPSEPTRLSIGHEFIQWGGFAGGVTRGLELRFEDVRLTGPKGEAVASLGALDISLSMGRLLLGQVVPRTVSVTGLRLRLVRDRAGRMTAELGGINLGGDDDSEAPGPGLADTIKELAQPPRLEGGPRRPGLEHIEQLQSVRIADAALQLREPSLGEDLRLGIASLNLQRLARGGVRGAATATLGLGAARATMTLQADLAPDGGTQVQAALYPVDAASMQQAAPELGAPAVLDAAVQAFGTLHLDAGLRPTAATLRADAGGGRIRVAGTPIGFDSLSVALEGKWDAPAWRLPERLTVTRGKAVLHAPGGAWPTTVTLNGQVSRTANRITGAAEASIDHLAFADIGSLWPARLGGHVRPWLVENVTAGAARDGSVKLAFEAPLDLSGAVLTAVDGSLRGEGLSIHWLKPVPPIEQAQAVLTIKNPQTLDIAVSSARQGALALKDGAIRITGLSDKDQFLALDAAISGGVPEALALLRHPRLALLDRKPIPMRNPGGTFSGRANVTFPLNDDLSFDEIKIQSAVRVNDLRLGGLVAGRDLERGAMQLDVTSDSLKAAGSATVAGIAADVTVAMDFRNGPPGQLVQQATASGRATGKQLAASRWFDPGGLMPSGAGLFTAKYAQRRDGAAEVQITGDLAGASLGLAGWTKAAGQPAEMAARLMLRGDRMLGIDRLRAQGPGMAMEGRVDMVGADPLLLVLDRLELGATRARGQVRFPDRPGQPIRATLDGAVLDLAAELARKPPAGGAPAETSPPFIADVRFDRVLLAGDRGLSGVTAHAEHDGRRLAVLTAATAAPERVELTIRPEGRGRRLFLSAEDGGGLFRAMDILDTVRGGRLKLDGLYNDGVPASPIAGTVELSDFNVRNGRLLGKLLQAATIYGLVDALNSTGVSFTELILPFRWDGTVLEIDRHAGVQLIAGRDGEGAHQRRAQDDRHPGHRGAAVCAELDVGPHPGGGAAVQRGARRRPGFGGLHDARAGRRPGGDGQPPVGIDPRVPPWAVPYLRLTTGGGAMTVRALLFDVFGTVVDWRGSLINELAEWGERRGLTADWTGLVDAWRAAYAPSMDRVRRGEMPWTMLDRLHRASLDVLAPQFGLSGLAEADMDWVNRGWHRLRPWPDSVGGLTRLKQARIISPLSNGNVALLANMAKQAGLPWDLVLCAEVFRHYKPDPETYLGAAAMLGLAPGEVMLCAAHNQDLAAAQLLGLRTAFIARPTEYGPHQVRDFGPEGEWDVAVDSIEALADWIAAKPN